jgi:hypothetical protein
MIVITVGALIMIVISSPSNDCDKCWCINNDVC